MKALIIGGGIGGLSAATALRRVGFEVEVHERAPELAEVGSGLSLWRNALAALDRLGVLETLRPAGLPGQVGSFRDAGGRILMTVKTGSVDQAPENMLLLVHRAELLSALIESVGRDSIRLGSRFVGLEQDEAGVRARFDDGREARGDLLIGADGLRSAVRESLFGSHPPRYGGYTTWRAIANFDPARLAPGETWGRGRRIGRWGMAGGRSYWYATRTVPEGQDDPARGRKQRLLDLFRGWHDPIEELIEATDEAAIIHSDVYDRPAMDRWGTGRVTLLGDAAHPMTPDMGQGACQAIEDALVLSETLDGSTEIPGALRAYEARRVPRTRRVVRESSRAGTIGQWSNPLACRLRDRLMQTRFAARKQAELLNWMIASPWPSPSPNHQEPSR